MAFRHDLPSTAPMKRRHQRRRELIDARLEPVFLEPVKNAQIVDRARGAINDADPVVDFRTGR
jgi:hypothetical protein